MTRHENTKNIGKKILPDQFSSYAHHLSHEIRTPLNHIRGFAELMLIDGNIEKPHRDYVKAILQGSDALQAAVLAHLKYVEEASPESHCTQ